MKSINLLPADRQGQLRQELIFHNFLRVLWLSLFSFALVLILQFLGRLYLLRQAKIVTQQVEQLRQLVNRQDNAKVKAQITVVNNYISDYQNLIASSPRWSKMLRVFAPVPPQDVSINSLNVDLAKRRVTIMGFAPTRESVISMYNNLVANPNFTNVDYPLENVAKPTNINFHFSFTIDASLLN